MNEAHILEEYEKAITLYNDGKTIREISEILNIPYATIYRWVKNISKPIKYTRKDYERVMELNAEGYGIREIAKRTGIPKTTVFNWIKYRVGETRYLSERHKYDIDIYYKALRLYKEGHSIAEISNILELPYPTIYEWVSKRKEPEDIKLSVIRKFSEFITKNCINRSSAKYNELRMIRVFNKFIEKYYQSNNLVCLSKEEYMPLISYLYGVRFTDGSLYCDKNRGIWRLEVTGELLFLRRINQVIKKLIGKEYSIYKSKHRDMWITRISNKKLYLILQKSLEEIKPTIEHSNETIRAFLIGICDGDGYLARNKKKYTMGFSNAKYHNLVTYSKELLIKLGVKTRLFMRKSGKSYKSKKGIIHRKKSVLGWTCNPFEFIAKVGISIKISKRYKELPATLQKTIIERLKDDPIPHPHFL